VERAALTGAEAPEGGGRGYVRGEQPRGQAVMFNLCSTRYCCRYYNKLPLRKNSVKSRKINVILHACHESKLHEFIHINEFWHCIGMRAEIKQIKFVGFLA
jgi:hypothetical protein